MVCQTRLDNSFIPSPYRRAAECEKAHGTRESVDELLARAVKFCPHAEVLWLMWAKERWMAGDVPAAREILGRVRTKPARRPSIFTRTVLPSQIQFVRVCPLFVVEQHLSYLALGCGRKGLRWLQAFAAKADSEAIWLAAFKLEFENEEPLRARALMVKARDSPVQTQRVWMKSAIVERELVRMQPLPCLAATVWSACVQWPKHAVPCSLSGRCHVAQLLPQNNPSAQCSACWDNVCRLCPFDAQGNTEEELRLLEEGLQRFPAFDKLWLMLGQSEERRGRTAAARTAYQSGLKRCIHRCESHGPVARGGA